MLTRRSQILLFLACFATFAWFHQGGGWNQNARFAEVRAIVERGTVAIDDFLVYHPVPGSQVLERARVVNGEFMHAGRLHQISWGEWRNHGSLDSPDRRRMTVAGKPATSNAEIVIMGEGTCTGDSGYAPDGRFHPNKPPGASLLAVPAYFAAFHIERIAGLNPDDWWVVTVNAWLCTVFTVALASAIGVLLMLRAGNALFPGSRGALPAALAFGFGTTFFPFGTLMFDHNLTAVLLLGSFMAVRGDRPALGGMLSGVAALTNYLAGLPGAVLGVWALFRGKQPWWNSAGRFLLGVLPCFVSLLAYNTAAFGSPFTLNTSFQNPAFKEAAPAFLGMFTAPSWFAALTITVSPWRGLFALCPVLLPAVAALFRWPARLRSERRIIVSVSVFFFVVNICFNGFHSGFAAGPRYLIPALPFLGLALVPAFDRWRQTTRILAVVSVFQQALLTVTDALNPLGVGDHAWHDHPGEWIEKLTGNSLVWRYAWPLFKDGRATPVIASEFDEWRGGRSLTGDELREARRRIERGESSPLLIAAMPGPVSVNVMTMWEGSYFSLHPAHSPQCDWAAWNMGELVMPRSRWSLMPLVAMWAVFGWGICRRKR